MKTTPEQAAPPGGAGEVRRVIFSEERIARRVGELGEEVTAHYGNDADLLVLGLLKGSFIFMADLVRAIDRPLELDFIVAASYGSGRESSGEVEVLYGPGASFEGRHLLLVEDIVDSGTTLDRLVPRLEESGPASVEVCALLHKRLVTLEREPRWVGFDCPSEFVVGYGLDYAEQFRHLPFIGSL